MSDTRRRSGYTLIELLAVIAIIILIGGVLAPTIRMLSGDTKVKAGADIIRARMSEARAAAIEEGRSYRVAISQDGKCVRVAPDDLDIGGHVPTDDENPPVIVEEEMPQNVTAVPHFDEGVQPVV